ncbi:RHS repeat-associated core domain-containing protein [Nonomuraea sp. NPDC049714]|uniref:RHS repeat-associated core domain-containing protein n=1 Tax=Nonomuraea sp. NPDC049714 TaxID=3364357 RepID=UPI0037A10B7B
MYDPEDLPEPDRSTFLIFEWYPRKFRWFVRACAAIAVLIVVPLVYAMPAQAAPRERPEVQKEEPVPGKPVPVLPKAKDAAAERALKAAPAVAWPKPGTAEVTPGGAKAGSLPVSLAAPENAEARRAQPPPERVKVEILDRAKTPAVDGVALRLSQGQDAGRGGRAQVELDYSGFRQAFGGDYAARLELVELPDCALTDTGASCPEPKPVPAENDVKAGTLTADVEVAASGSRLYALTAAASGASGDYSATSLAPSSKWSVGPQSGDFSWNHPMRAPPSIGGEEPVISLNYSSQSVDGRTSATNNQVSWAGEGFDLTPGGYVERRYKSCMADGRKTGDLCWDHDNATLMLNGSAVELVKDATTKAWRPKRDDGTRIELLTGATNGDNNGEYWRLTTTDGTQYHFGLNRLPGWASGKPETKSAWTVPVFGNEAGEPCHDSTPANAWCQQAWRWNLDYSVDRHGNATTHWYATETNHYGRNEKPELGTAYVRGGYLTRIDYGYRSAELFTGAPAARVAFTVAERCVPSGSITCEPGQLTKDTANHWPDVPFDRKCDAGETCKDRLSPTFWTRKRLAKVTTEVRSGTGYQDVDSWTLTHSFPATGDGLSPALWLNSVQHTGHVRGTVTLPKVTFAGVQLKNRVDTDEGRAPLYKWRVQSINTEAGAEIRVNYAPEECTPGNPPAADSNTKRCFPQRWAPQDEMQVLDWFHKYVVAQTVEIDRTARSPWMVTDFEYLDGAAWRYAEHILIKPKERTWSDWRGYARVRVRQGDGQDGPRTMVEHRYYRGMHGDRLDSGSRKDVKVTDSEGKARDDHDQLAGADLETIVYDGDGGKMLSATVEEPWWRKTAEFTFEGVTKTAHLVQSAKMTTRDLKEDGTWRRTAEERAYDEHGMITQVGDLGDVADPADDICTRNTYTRDTGTWMLDFVSRVETVGRACSAEPQRPADVLSDERFHFDGRAFGQPPVRGDVTREEELASYDGTTPRYVLDVAHGYDAYGRVTSETDAAGGSTTTAYVPASGAQATEVRSTNPLGHADVTYVDPAWGEPVAEEDENGRRTDLEHDALGRLVKVWQHDRDKAAGQSPNTEYSYQIRTDGPNIVTSRTLATTGEYIVSHELYDGLLRPRQTQEPAPGGGRVVTDTFHNSIGEVAKSNEGYYATGDASTQLLGVADDDVAGQVVSSFDGTGELVTQSYRVKGQEQWKTSVRRAADRSHVTPPPGGSAATVLSDAEGRMVEQRLYKGTTPAGEYATTKYTYDKAGRLASVTDSAGNTWRHHYDLRDREVKTEDPDKGVTTRMFNDLDEEVSSTDARGRTLTHTYDALGRMTSTREGTTTLAEWRYDALAKGHLNESIRYVGGQAYAAKIEAIDREYRTLRQSVTVPEREGQLAGTYVFNTRYTADDQVQSITFPAAGGLPDETVTYGYDELRQPTKVEGLSTYVTDARYSKLGETLQYELSTGGPKSWLTRTHEEGTRRLIRSQLDRDVGTSSDLDLRYTYDAIGNITRIADRDVDTQCFTYDPLRRLTAAWTATDACASGAPRSDLIGGAAPYATSYAYDSTGNRTKETHHAFGGRAETVRDYVYPSPGQPRPHALTSVTPTGPGQPSAYEYDAAGNTITRRTGTAEQRLAWDAEGNLESVTEGGTTTSFVYDADGDRLLRKTPTDTTLYVDDMELRLDHAKKVVDGTRYYTVNGEAVAVRTSAGKVYFFAGDHHGTAHAAIDAQTGELAIRRQTPFGADRGAPPPWWPGERGFVGGTVDPTTKLVHLGAREYDPAIGRFLSVDPVIDEADPQQMNGYAYANNSPVSMTDPDGQLFWFAAGIALRIALRAAARRAAQAAARRAAEAAARRAALAAARRRAAEIARRKAIEAAKKRAAELARKKAAAEAKKKAMEKAKKAAEAAVRRKAAAARARAAAARARARAIASRARAAAARARAKAAQKIKRAVTRRAKPARARPNHRPTTRRAQQRSTPPKAQRNPSTNNQVQPRRGLSDSQKRSIDEQMGVRRYDSSELRSYSQTQRPAKDYVPHQGTGNSPGYTRYRSDTPRSGKGGRTWLWYIWEVFRPPAGP